MNASEVLVWEIRWGTAGIWIDRCMHGDQRATLGVMPQVCFIFFFDTESLWPELCHVGRLASL